MSVFTAGRENGHRRPRGYADWNPHAPTRKLLADVDDVLERYADYLPLTIRQVFYALVGAERFDKTEQSYARLCEHLNRARRARLVAFEDIRDDGVVVIESPSYTGVRGFHDETAFRMRSYRRDRQDFQDCYVELWCEASGMMRQLAKVADVYSVPVYSCGGFSSLSAVRQIADRAVDRNVPTVLLHVGDLDPSGESIFTAMTDDAARFVEADRTLVRSRIDAERVALTREQVDEYDLPLAPAKASDSRSASWDGGTCQLEALPPDLLAELVRHAILDELDEHILHRVLEIERTERAELLGLPRGQA